MQSVFPFETLPRPVRQLAVFGMGWRNRLARYGKEYDALRRFLVESARWNRAQREAWQAAELKRLLSRIRFSTAHYADMHNPIECAMARGDLNEALSCLPVLEKDELRKAPERFRNSAVPEFTRSSTSGSTGAPMHVGHDRASIQRRFAFLVDHLAMVGLDPTAPSIRLSGRIICPTGRSQARPWLSNRAENQIFVSTYHLNEAHARAISDMIRRSQPQLIDGYPSAVLDLLSLLDRQGVVISSLKAVVTTAETMHPDLRERIEAHARVPVLDYYAASEGVPLIQQCPRGTYHVRWQSGIFEVARDGMVMAEGDGELVCTSFVQDRMPLIRYRTGDLVEGFSREGTDCSCGLRTPTVKAIIGRLEDLVVTPDGRRLGMFTYRTLKTIEGLGETQVLQHDFDRFEVRSVVRNGHNPAHLKDALKVNFERALGYPIQLDFRPVERLDKGPNGKVRLVISAVAKGNAQNAASHH